MENQVKTEVAVKKVAPHYMEVNPPKSHITVVRPFFCQHKKVWTIRVVNEKGEQIKSFVAKEHQKELVKNTWVDFMKKYHNVSNAKL